MDDKYENLKASIEKAFEESLEGFEEEIVNEEEIETQFAEIAAEMEE